jgi:hypothetical protein
MRNLLIFFTRVKGGQEAVRISMPMAYLSSKLLVTYRAKVTIF